MKRILHPSDFSSASPPAFKKALELAKTNRAVLDVLHVMTPVIPAYGGMSMSAKVYDDIAASTTAWARKAMNQLLKKARAAGVTTTSSIVEGTPADRIIRAARARRADLIVMGTHGRTGFSRFLVGSVASRVIAASPYPVLTVRGK